MAIGRNKRRLALFLGMAICCLLVELAGQICVRFGTKAISAGSDLPCEAEGVPCVVKHHETQDIPPLSANFPSKFWEAYAADRNSLLQQGFRDGAETEGKCEDGGDGDIGSPNRCKKPTRYLVFRPSGAGLGNVMSGMMSAFLLSIATERVFLHEWTTTTKMCGATYDDLFVAPFEPWAALIPASTRVSSSGGFLVDTQDGGEGQQSGTPKEGWEQRGQQRGNVSEVTGGIWGGVLTSERERCHLDLTQKGVESGEFDRVLIERRGQDPRPDCPVLYITSNQFFGEVVASATYGSSKVAGTPLSEWLQAGNITQTLFAGLFRPVAVVRQQVADAAVRLFPSSGQRMAAHARAWHLRQPGLPEAFVECLNRWGVANNVSTVVLATDFGNFTKYTEPLASNNIEVVSMNGVKRVGEGHRMRDTLDKMHNAVVELFLVAEADIVITSPKSSFSALAAAAGGRSTQRVGGMSCEAVLNEPEFHMLECGMGAMLLNQSRWRQVYPSVGESNRERCLS